jgi:hypothetical protein
MHASHQSVGSGLLVAWILTAKTTGVRSPRAAAS